MKKNYIVLIFLLFASMTSHSTPPEEDSSEKPLMALIFNRLADCGKDNEFDTFQSFLDGIEKEDVEVQKKLIEYAHGDQEQSDVAYNVFNKLLVAGNETEVNKTKGNKKIEWVAKRPRGRTWIQENILKFVPVFFTANQVDGKAGSTCSDQNDFLSVREKSIYSAGMMRAEVVNEYLGIPGLWLQNYHMALGRGCDEWAQKMIIRFFESDRKEWVDAAVFILAVHCNRVFSQDKRISIYGEMENEAERIERARQVRWAWSYIASAYGGNKKKKALCKKVLEHTEWLRAAGAYDDDRKDVISFYKNLDKNFSVPPLNKSERVFIKIFEKII